MMKKRALTLFVSLILLVILSTSFVSAGLCKGSDGYYHDCDDFSDNYYRNNFHTNYITEYSKESSSSSYESEYVKEDKWGYEKENTYSYEESNYEKYETKRDYSNPKKSKTYFRDKYTNSRYDYGDKYENSDKYDYWKRYDYEDKYWRDYYDSYNYEDEKERYEWDENQLTVFVNKVEPIHYRRRANTEREMNADDWASDSSLTWPYS